MLDDTKYIYNDIVSPIPRYEHRLKLKQITVFTFLLFGILISAYGFINTEFLRNFLIQNFSSFYQFHTNYLSYLICFFSLLIFIFISSVWSKKSPYLISALLGLLIACLTDNLWPLLVTIWFFVASYLLGSQLIRKLSLDADNKCSQIILTLIGAGIFATISYFLSFFPINYPGIYGLLLLIPLITSYKKIRALSALKFSFQGYRLLDTIIATLSLIYLAISLMPEIGHDALVMHLFIPGHMSYRHLWDFDVSKYDLLMLQIQQITIFSSYKNV